jgi:signal transduction histidine kinase
MKLPRRTVRLRLALLYGSLFLVSGAVLLGITYGLVREATDGVYVYRGPNGIAGAVIVSPGKSPGTRAPGGARINVNDDAPKNLTPKQLRAQSRQIDSLARQQHADQLHLLLTRSAVALGIMTLISLVLGWFVAGRALRPVRTITTRARAISATNLHERLALDGPDDELKDLGDTIDDLLARLDGAFEAQRQFVANASHELRTPLARQRTIAQVAAADPDATVDSLRAAHERVIAAGEEQTLLIDALLTLTRGQAGLARRREFDLTTITDAVVRARRAEADARDVHVHTALAAAPTTGDPDLAERLVTNLVDNALRHNRPGGRIEITTSVRNGHALLTVTNDGPTIPPSEVERLFEPLQRLDPARSGHADGHGLGLSIVRAVATAHTAGIVARARPDGGLHIEVDFPSTYVARADPGPAGVTPRRAGAARRRRPRRPSHAPLALHEHVIWPSAQGGAPDSPSA